MLYFLLPLLIPSSSLSSSSSEAWATNTSCICRVWVSLGDRRPEPKVTVSHRQNPRGKENLAVFGSGRGHLQSLLTWPEPGSLNQVHLTKTQNFASLGVPHWPTDHSWVTTAGGTQELCVGRHVRTSSWEDNESFGHSFLAFSLLALLLPEPFHTIPALYILCLCCPDTWLFLPVPMLGRD